MEHLYDDLDDSDSENVAPEREDYEPPLKVKKYSKVKNETKNAAENTIQTPESLKKPMVSSKTHVPIKNKPVNKMMTTPETHIHIPSNSLPKDPRKLHSFKNDKVHESPKNADLEIFTLTSENVILKNKLDSIERELIETRSRLERAEEGMLILIKHGNIEFNNNAKLKKEALDIKNGAPTDLKSLIVKSEVPNDDGMASKIEIDKLKLEIGVLKNKNASLQNQVNTSKTTDRHGNERRDRDRNIVNRRDYDRLQYDYDKTKDDKAQLRDRNSRLEEDLLLQKEVLKKSAEVFKKKTAKDHEKIKELEGQIESMAVNIFKHKDVSVETVRISSGNSHDRIIDKTDRQSMTDNITVFNKFTETVPKLIQNRSTNTKLCDTTETGCQTLANRKLDTVVLARTEITEACFENAKLKFY